MFTCAELLPTTARPGIQPMVLTVAPIREGRPVATDQPVLMLLRRGRLLLTSRAGDAPQAFGPGAVTLDPSRADFAAERWSSSSGVQYGAIEMAPEACETLLRCEAPWARAGDAPFRFSDPKVAWWLEEIIEHCSAGEPHGGLYTESASVALLTYLASLRSARPPKSSPGAGPLSQQAVRKVREYVDDHLTDTLSIKDLADLCGCSPGHLNRVFRATVGLPIYRFVIERRIEHARSLLQADNMSLVEVAISCGFANQSHFSTAFRRHVGFTPGEFRAKGGSFDSACTA